MYLQKKTLKLIIHSDRSVVENMFIVTDHL